MSSWTYVDGVIEVRPMGRTQPEERYVLDTVLSHLPRVSGSERDMGVHVIQKYGHDYWSSTDEFGTGLPLNQIFKIQEHYILALEGSMRDTKFHETVRNLNKWLNRLAKRVLVTGILVRVRDQYERSLVIQNEEPYGQMFEEPSWSSLNKAGDPAWYEYLLWESDPCSGFPLSLVRKYCADEELDAEYARRKEWLEKRAADAFHEALQDV